MGSLSNVKDMFSCFSFYCLLKTVLISLYFFISVCPVFISLKIVFYYLLNVAFCLCKALWISLCLNGAKYKNVPCFTLICRRCGRRVISIVLYLFYCVGVCQIINCVSIRGPRSWKAAFENSLCHSGTTRLSHVKHSFKSGRQMPPSLLINEASNRRILLGPTYRRIQCVLKMTLTSKLFGWLSYSKYRHLN